MGTSCTKSVWEARSQTLWVHPLFAFSFDHLVGAGKQAIRHGEAERLGGLPIEYDLILGWRLHRQVGRLLAFEDAVDVAGCLAELIDEIGPIRHQTAGSDKEAVPIGRRQFVPRRQRDDQLAV